MTQPPYQQPGPPYSQGAPQHQQQPPHAQQQPPYARQQPPPYARPSYLNTSPQAVEAIVRKARRDITFGCLWLLFGLVVTLYTMAHFDGAFILAWGPAVYGIYKIIKGLITLRKHS